MRDPLTDLAGLEGVPSAVAAALASVDAVLRDRGLRTVTPETAAASLLRGARGNAALTVDPERWLPGAVRLAAELAELAGVRGWLLHCARALGRGAEVSGLLEVRAPR